MNESNVVTIIGMIAAFITASITPIITESVKNFAQDKTKLQRLRIALYTEIVNNYYALTHFTMDGTHSDSYVLSGVTKYQLRTECYKHALQNELPLFYQLKEAKLLNLIYGMVNQLMNLSNDLLAIYGRRGLKSASSNFTQHGNTFKYMFTTSFACGAFDASILRKLVTPEQYEEVINKGKEHIESDAKSKGQ